VDRHVRQVLEHDRTVVRGLEVRVAGRDLVGALDGGQLEGLRGLAAAQPGAVRDLGDELAVQTVGARHDDGVRGRDGDVDGLEALQGDHAVVDHTAREQRTYGVVEQDVEVLALGQALAEGRDGALGGLVPGGATLDDLLDLREPGLGDDLLYVRNVARRHQDDDVVDGVGLLEGGQSVLDDCLAGDLQQLLGDRETHALTGTTGQDHCGGTGLGDVLGHRRPTSGRQGTGKWSHLRLPLCKVTAVHCICTRYLSFILHCP